MCVFLAVLLFCCSVGVHSSASCSNKTTCLQQMGPNSSCNNGNCTCNENYYQKSGDSCVQCPAIGESCHESQCCNADYLVCHNSVCMCGYNDFCWNVNEEERARFQRVAQCILAVALMLTAAILFILFWKSCRRRSVVRRDIRNMSADSFLSLNSIQRLVLLQLQDRPPPYNPEIMLSKNMNELSEPPPSYFEALGVPEQTSGEDNYVFILEEFSRDNANRRPSAGRVLIPFQSRRSSTINTSEVLQNTNTANSLTSDTQTNSSPSVNVVPLQALPHQNNSSECPDTYLVVMTNAELHI